MSPPTRMAPGRDRWKFTDTRRGRLESEDSETERGQRSASRSDLSSGKTAGHGEENSFPEGHGNGSLETIPDAAPIIPHWSLKRHLTCGNPTPGPSWSSKLPPWRGISPGKLKTSHAALVLCLNIDVDPPDIVKTHPCAILECWVDPRTMPSNKALEAIGSNLKYQFDCLSPKLNYKPILDPSFEDLKRFCCNLRKQAKDDTVLFYYNGHGVPKPMPCGELWCFNRNYTQYIPVSLSDLQEWLGSPGVYIWDCSAAGRLLQNFITFSERRDHEVKMKHGGYPEGQQPFMNSLQLAACAADEQLPSYPELPADLFTSCLTSPIDIALRYFIMTHQLPSVVDADTVIQLPGDLKDRRTPLGELNWIFTAITDTIAWTTFSRDVFTRLYRSDLLIASLFRNFLLAERIMKDHHCTPHTYPPLPPTNTHPMWAAWDLAVDTCLRQLPNLLSPSPSLVPRAAPSVLERSASHPPISRPENLCQGGPKLVEKRYTYVPNRFFSDQLTAFEVWISRGGSALTKRGPMSLPLSNGTERYSMMEPCTEPKEQESHLVPRKPPDQLPIVLQVLLSQPHRLRALILLSQFVDLGPWAVHLVLTIGIFPYISKLLQAAGQDLRPVLIFIWARILAVDPSVQIDLFNTLGYKYFASVLAVQDDPNHNTLPNSSEHKAMCAFILSAIARGFPPGQRACWRVGVFDNCFDRLDAGDFLLRQWSSLCIGQMWDGHDEIKVYGVDRGTQDKLIALLLDDSCEVRAAALFALGTFMGASGSPDPIKQANSGTGTMFQLEERVHFLMEVAVATRATHAIKDDASPMVRKELLVLLSCLVKEWRGYFVVCAWIYWEEDRKWRAGPAAHPHDEDVTGQAIAEWLDGFAEDENVREENRVLLSSFFTIFVVLLEFSVDPYQEVATNAQTIVDYIMALLLESPFKHLDCATLHYPPTLPSDQKPGHPGGTRSRVPSLQSPPLIGTQPPSLTRPGITRTDSMTSTITSGVANTLKRTSSFANAIKHLAGGIAYPSSDDGHSTLNSGSVHTKFDYLDISRPPSPNLNVAQYTSPYSRPTSPPLHPGQNTPSTPSSREAPNQRAMVFLPYDVMEALIEEDMERLRARRRSGVHPLQHGGIYEPGPMASPSGSTFSSDSNGSNVILGMGTGVNIRDALPLKSLYFDWCCEYFTEPQMRQSEVDEPGSKQYNYQVWRQQRNEQVAADIQAHAEIAQTCKWERPMSTLHFTGLPLLMAFHSYDKHVFVANETDISVWDWSTRKRLACFCNGNQKGAGITSMHLINQDVGGIILTGSADGVVRLYRNYDPDPEQGPIQMVSAFRGLNEMIPVQQGSGLILDWKQAGGSVLAGGDSRIIRLWDANTETQTLDMETFSDAPVTSIISDSGSASTFVAGFADGTVKVFDRRMEEEDAIVRSYDAHSSWVQNVCWHPSYGSQILTAGLEGSVKLWDLRGSQSPLRTIELPYGLASFDVHPQTAVFATTSALTPSQWRSQRISIHPLMSAPPLSSFTVATGLGAYRPPPSPFIPRSTSFAFHPLEMVYGVGEPDGSVRIIGCKFD